MKFSRSSTSSTALMIVLLTACRWAVADPGGASVPATRHLNCDYSPLSQSSDRELFQQRCGTISATDHAALLAVLERIDPAAEARAAAQRGDFRLAAYVVGGPPPPGLQRYWKVGGIDCTSLDDGDVLIWYAGLAGTDAGSGSAGGGVAAGTAGDG
jgi:hypothetical protein